jgi:hypothetical protein
MAAWKIVPSAFSIVNATIDRVQSQSASAVALGRNPDMLHDAAHAVAGCGAVAGPFMSFREFLGTY